MKQRQRPGTHRKPEKIYSPQEANDRLFDIFRNHDFGDFPHAQRAQLVEYYQLLMTHQLTDNVTRLVKFNEIAIKHFIDSLIVPQLTTLMFPLVDVGSGPGFPGIPLKIVFPKERIILSEGVRRRVEFLKAVRDEMGLKELQVIGRKIDPTFELPVKGVITRAFAETGATLNDISRCLEVGGQVYLMKGPNVDPELKKAQKDWGEYFELVEDHAYDLPKTPHKRRLIVFRKIKSMTPLPLDDADE